MFKILVVEDDNDLNRTVCLFLNQRGYEAEGCLNVNDAYDKMYETVFDLIVSDIIEHQYLRDFFEIYLYAKEQYNI